MNATISKLIKTKDIPYSVRQAVLNRADGRCEDCGNELYLELHHLRYTTVINGEPDVIFGYETEDDLAALCRHCHHNRHRDCNGDFWLDPEEMFHYWWHDEGPNQ